MKNKNCILICCNRPYLQQANFLAWQLSRQANRNYDIYIASDDFLSNDDVSSEIKVLQVKDVNYWKGLGKSDRLSYYAYLRLPAIDQLSKKYKKLLYLDTDIFVDTYNIGSIFQIDLKGNILGAIRDVQQYFRRQKFVSDFRLNNLGPAPYFNSGVLLIDCDLWLAANCYQEIKESSKKYALPRHDQTLLNIIFYNKWSELSQTWNFMENKYFNIWGLYFGAKLIHINRNKIWSNGKFSAPFCYINRYHEYIKLKNNIEYQQEKTKFRLRYLINIISGLIILPYIWHHMNRIPDDSQSYPIGEQTRRA